MRIPGAERFISAAALAAAGLVLAACAGPGELPCEGDARLCPDAGMAGLAAGTGAGAGAGGPSSLVTETILAGQASPRGLCVERPNSCLQPGQREPRRSINEGPPGRPSSADEIRLRTRATALGTDIARLPRDRGNRADTRVSERDALIGERRGIEAQIRSARQGGPPIPVLREIPDGPSFRPSTRR